MSYDLMVFAAEVAPDNRNDFLAWYAVQSQWSEAHSYNHPEVATPELRMWFFDMIRVFPPMNGPYATEDMPTDEASLTDYSIGHHVIYAAFAWSKSGIAFETSFRLASKYGLGFFDVSSRESTIWLPNHRGSLRVVHQ